MQWRLGTQCRTCQGTKKEGINKCSGCDGHGHYITKDVTDMIILPIPDRDGVKLAPDIAGFISPDLNTWNAYTNELESLENQAYETLWGVSNKNVKSINNTATEAMLDNQSLINKLNDYADVAEFVTWKLCELVANFYLPLKDKSESVTLLTYGRRFMIESPDELIKRYNLERASGANDIILDRYLQEYLQVKYRNDISYLKEEQLKLLVQPYNHFDITTINTIFGADEAKKQVYFNKWWSSLPQLEKFKTADELIYKLNNDFDNSKVDIADSNKTADA
jgi:hypothetical protein